MIRSPRIPRLGFLLPAILVLACVHAAPRARHVRLTSNPDVVKGCKFLGNVQATSGWGGGSAGSLGARNIEETLKERAHDLGANVVFMGEIRGGMFARGTGEAYACAAEVPAAN